MYCYTISPSIFRLLYSTTRLLFLHIAAMLLIFTFHPPSFFHLYICNGPSAHPDSHNPDSNASCKRWHDTPGNGQWKEAALFLRRIPGIPCFHMSGNRYVPVVFAFRRLSESVPMPCKPGRSASRNKPGRKSLFPSALCNSSHTAFGIILPGIPVFSLRF